MTRSAILEEKKNAKDISAERISYLAHCVWRSLLANIQ
jgi:hypothetical protein